jgi:radical SAM protein with 4Fe4S-binding SPASM domain
LKTEVLTVDNHADAPYLYLKLKEKDPSRAEEVYKLMQWNGGNNSGIAIGCVDEKGDVHADQFWRHYSLGNVRKRPFGDIWTDTSDPLMAGLKNRKALLEGRCAECRFLEICNGNFRVRAEATWGRTWAPDPACYLTDQEIGVSASVGAMA